MHERHCPPCDGLCHQGRDCPAANAPVSGWRRTWNSRVPFPPPDVAAAWDRLEAESGPPMPDSDGIGLFRLLWGAIAVVGLVALVVALL